MQLSLKYFKPKILILLVLGLSILFSIIIKHIPTEILYNWQIPTSTSIIVTVLFLISKYGIKFNLIRKLFFNVPYIGGRYKGYIQFNTLNDSSISEKQCIMEITQDGSFLFIKSFFFDNDINDYTYSASEYAEIIVQEDNTYKLIFTYTNNGNHNLNFSPHHGTNVLSIILNKNKITLKGGYYTNRLPIQTKGNITLHYESKNIKGDI